MFKSSGSTTHHATNHVLKFVRSWKVTFDIWYWKMSKAKLDGLSFSLRLGLNIDKSSIKHSTTHSFKNSSPSNKDSESQLCISVEILGQSMPFLWQQATPDKWIIMFGLDDIDMVGPVHSMQVTNQAKLPNISCEVSLRWIVYSAAWHQRVARTCPTLKHK